MNKLVAVAIAVLAVSVQAVAQQIQATEQHSLRITTLTSDLKHPWAMAFHPSGDILITERPGTLRRFRNGSLSEPIKGVPQVAAINQGGLLDIALHPDDPDRVFLSYSEARQRGGYATTVATAKLAATGLQDVAVIFRAQPEKPGGRHFGSRLLFTNQGDLLITIGDRGDRPSAQDKSQHHGSIIRIKADQVTNTGNQPEIYSHGHRNQQGISNSCDGKNVWAHEHGPMGGDELNLIEQGKNYGWPTISYGVEYVTRIKIGEKHKQGLAQPVHKWVPSIGPSGLTCYNADKFTNWKGNLLLGSLIYNQLVRLVIGKNNKVIHEERILEDAIGRIRDVRVGPDGYIYLLSDQREGKLVRLEPAP